MRVKELFPEVFAKGAAINEPLWEETLSDHNIFHVDEFLGSQLENASREGVEVFLETSEDILKGFLSAKQTYPQLCPILNYLQFFHCTEVARFCVNQGLFPAAHDWLVRSINDEFEVGAEADFQIPRLREFIVSDNETIRLNAPTSVMHWMEQLFYYSRRHGGLKEFAKLIEAGSGSFARRYSSKLFTDSYDELQKCRTLCQLLSWSAIYIPEQTVIYVRELESLYNSSGDRNVKKLAAIQLSGDGFKHTKKTGQAWALLALENYADLLSHHEHLACLNNLCVNDFAKIQERYYEIRYAICKYVKEANSPDSLTLKYERSRIFGVMNGIVQTCLEHGNTAIPLTFICDFYEIPEAIRVSEKQLILLLNHHPSAIAANSGSLVKLNDTEKPLRMELVTRTNKFLGRTIAVNDSAEFVIETPARGIGHPIIEEGGKFFDILSQCFQFPPLDLDVCEAMLVLPSVSYPIQNLMIKQRGSTLPELVSLQKSKGFHGCKRVLLWCDDSTWTGIVERENVKLILDKAGISVKVVEVSKATREDFMHYYNSKEFDLVWVASHGKYDHYLPHTSTIPISEKIEIDLPSISTQCPELNRQRLLFLNICEGATAASSEGVINTGLAASLCSGDQATMSHLWPVEPKIALIYALLFAHFVATGMSFFSSYVQTVKVILKGKDQIAAILKAYNLTDDAQRIISGLDESIATNIYYWGSVAYYH